MELSVALEKPCYYPGEVLRCLIKVWRLGDGPGPQQPQQGAAAAAPEEEALQLLFECSGSERVDPSWVGLLYRPEVTAIKDNRRLVRSIFSTGQVPLLSDADGRSLGGGSGREFIVRCRLPSKLPPSYRGNAARFVYRVAVQGQLQHRGEQQQQQQPPASCQAQMSFVVWPMAERSGLDRLGSIPHPQGAGTADGAAGGSAAGGTGDHVELIDYRLGMTLLKLRWEEVVQHADGTRTLLAHAPQPHLYPPSLLTSRSSVASQLMAAQLSALDSLMLDEPPQRDGRRGGGSGGSGGGGAPPGEDGDGGGDADGDGDGDGEGGGPLRHLTAAQRASMVARTYNLRHGDHPLLRVVLQPPTDGLLQPGGTFGLLLDLRTAHSAPPGSSEQPVCLQVVALLESEEVVCAPHAHARGADCAAMRKLHSEQQEVTAHLLSSHFVFSIPLTASPSFRTPMVAHRWVLRFELTLGRPRPQRPAELVTERIVWSLPLAVFPPPPHAAMGM